MYVSKAGSRSTGSSVHFQLVNNNHALTIVIIRTRTRFSWAYRAFVLPPPDPAARPPKWNRRTKCIAYTRNTISDNFADRAFMSVGCVWVYIFARFRLNPGNNEMEFYTLPTIFHCKLYTAPRLYYILEILTAPHILPYLCL